MGFKIGDIVMRVDGDKRPHKVVDITVHYPLNSREHTFFQYHYEDGGSDISDSRYIVPYDGKYKRNKVMKANEAPEKLYIDFRDRAESTWRCAYTEKAKANDIEYTRTDVFIEKAEKFIYSALNDGIMGTANIEDFMRLFKKYMEGE